jgi:hypothetical protein
MTTSIVKYIVIIFSYTLKLTDRFLEMWHKFKRRKDIVEDKKTTEDIKKEVSDGSIDELNKRWGWKNDDKK